MGKENKDVDRLPVRGHGYPGQVEVVFDPVDVKIRINREGKVIYLRAAKEVFSAKVVGA